MSKKEIEIAKNRLSSGEVVIFPTETVYGIGCDATKDMAVNLLYKLKKRPKNNPIICHFANLEDIKKNFYINKTELLLAEKFWPGPLTLILKKKKISKISPLVSNHNEYVGCRIPKNKITQELLSKVKFPIAAPSANITSETSVTLPEDLNPFFKENILILNDGPAKLGLESTVLKINKNIIEILRLGSLSEEMINKKINNEIIINQKSNLSPGNLLKHYSPKKPLRMNIKSVNDNEGLLNFGSTNLFSKVFNLNLSSKGNLEEAANNFFHYIHLLDQSKCQKIAVVPIPNIGLGKTLNDRLKRSSFKN